MEAFQVYRDYNAQAPKKTKDLGKQIVYTVLFLLLALILYKYLYTPLRRSGLEKQIASLKGQLGAL